MNTIFNKRFWTISGLMIVIFTSQAQTNLLLLGTCTMPGGAGNYQLIYDSALNITWLDYTHGDATPGNYASSSYSWNNQMAWVSGLSVTFNGTNISGWTLPTITDGPIGGGSCTGNQNVGYNIVNPAYQMNYLYYVELGNKAPCDTNGNSQTGYGMLNTGPFQHLQARTIYWSGTSSSERPADAWYFDTSTGGESVNYQSYGMNALAVHAGNVTPLPPSSPTITSQPQNAPVYAHSNASFTVSSTGTAPLAYQWSINGSNILYGTSSALSVTNVTQANLGSYFVVITNYSGSVTSSVANLTMYPYIQSPFTGLDTYWGAANTLSIGAWGTGPLYYQWYFDGTPIQGATNATLVLQSIQFTNAGFYSATVTSSLGSVTNQPYQVVVNPANVSLAICPNVVIQGTVGYSFIIQSTTNLADTNSWITETNLTLTQPIQYWDDTSVDVRLPSNPKKFYRVLPGQ